MLLAVVNDTADPDCLHICFYQEDLFQFTEWVIVLIEDRIKLKHMTLVKNEQW